MHGDRNQWNPEVGPPERYPLTAPHPHPEVTGPGARPRGAAPQRRASRARAWTVFAIVAVGLFLLCGTGMTYAILKADPGAEPFVVPSATGQWSAPAHPSTEAATQTMMVLEVTGTGKADISWNVSGTGGQQIGAPLPWSKQLGPFNGFQVVSLVAQIKNGTTSAAVRAKITYGDKVTDCEGQGPYAVATCTADTQGA